ncbi:hypothetical protein V1514DRAFT_332558 [Lipomyces japonicus]|uniref:uncharacterized protein n=1 Tax=Lipomyces japonicus TaxID=56871 RepID=UPI0034CF6602
MTKRHANASSLTKHYATINNSSSHLQHQEQQQQVEPASVTQMIEASRARAAAAAQAQALQAHAQAQAASTSSPAGLVTSVETDVFNNSSYSLSEFLSNSDAVGTSGFRQTQHARRRTFAGPPPPPTWIAREQGNNLTTLPGMQVREKVINQYAAIAKLRLQSSFLKFRADRNVLDRNLPAAPYSILAELLPRPGSLTHWCMISMARNWEFNLVYLQHYLPDLDPAMKMVLVAYLGKYSPHGIGPTGLHILFDPQYQEQSGNSDDDHDDRDDHDGWEKAATADLNDRIVSLDLAFQIDDSNLSLQMLSGFMGQPLTLRIFPFLSALCLAFPFTNSPTKLWSSLLDILKTYPTLTSLSLAGWPIPPEIFYSTPETRAHVYSPNSTIMTLVNLSRASYCLNWIDLSYCAWIDETSIQSIEWKNGWKNVRVLTLRGIKGLDKIMDIMKLINPDLEIIS